MFVACAMPRLRLLVNMPDCRSASPSACRHASLLPSLLIVLRTCPELRVLRQFIRAHADGQQEARHGYYADDVYALAFAFEAYFSTRRRCPRDALVAKTRRQTKRNRRRLFGSGFILTPRNRRAMREPLLMRKSH